MTTKSNEKNSKYSQPLMDMLNGGEITEPVFKIGREGKPVFEQNAVLTLERACVAALNYRQQGQFGPVELTPEQSGERYELMKKIRSGQELKTTEKAIIIDLAKKAFNPMLSGQLEELLG